MIKRGVKKVRRRPHWAQCLALIRECTGLSQEKFGETIGVSKGAFELYENGKREPNFSTLRRIRRIYMIPLDMLICEPGDPRISSGGRDFDLATAPRDQQVRYLEAVLRATEQRQADGQPKSQLPPPSSARIPDRSKPQ